MSQQLHARRFVTFAERVRGAARVRRAWASGREGKLLSEAQMQLFHWHCAHVEYATAADIHSLSA
eukprot:1175235-Rhodomonas_salina.1